MPYRVPSMIFVGCFVEFKHKLPWRHNGRDSFSTHHCLGAIASQLTTVYSTVYSGADQRKHQSSASLAFVRGSHRGPVNSPHKWPVTRKMFPFDDVIMRHSIRHNCALAAGHNSNRRKLPNEAGLNKRPQHNDYNRLALILTILAIETPGLWQKSKWHILWGWDNLVQKKVKP